MSADQVKVPSPTREAWAALSDEFADIGRRFRENYEQVTETASTGTDQSRKSIDRAVDAIRIAINGTAHAIGESLRDAKLREETEEAGSALLRAVGVTLSELGQTLQRDADREEQGAAPEQQGAAPEQQGAAPEQQGAAPEQQQEGGNAQVN